MPNARAWFGVAGIVLLSSLLPADGQGPISPRSQKHQTSASRRPRTFRLDATMVLVPVSVTDEAGHPVRGLQKHDFRLFEDGAEQEIRQISNEDAPVSVGIVFDASNSMKPKIEQSRQAVARILQLSPPEDEFFFVRFSDAPALLCGFTMDAGRIEKAVQSVEVGGWTALYDAVYLAINGMKRASYSRRALVVLSDGEDNNSRYSHSEIRDLVREADVRILVISVRDHSRRLENLAKESGGQAYRVHNLKDLPDVAEKASEELHSHYVLGYSPMNEAEDGKYRKVQVKLAGPLATGRRLRISWRRGYYAPAQ